MKLSQIRATLQQIGVSPVKTLGQNFLHDRNLARWIVSQANLAPQDYVVEIGPGLGALTEFALAGGARVLAIEKDARLATFLREKFQNHLLEILHADALRFDVRELYAQPQVKLLGNLPYYVSSQLLLKFVAFPSPISMWLLMLQRELARRLSAAPSTPDYGALTLLIQLHHRVEYLRTVPASVFIPRPEVDSAIVRIVPRDPFELPASNPELFKKLVRLGFAQRRKQLGKLLRECVKDWPNAAAALELDRQARAEELSLQQWIGLTNYVQSLESDRQQNHDTEGFPVVNENDRVVGAAPRSKVHGDNLRHRAVHILVFNPSGEVFLQKRARWKDRHPLRWDSSAAGHVHAGEKYDDAARRELKEELGLTEPLQRVIKLPASERTDQEFVWLYRAVSSKTPQVNHSEIDAGDFFAPHLVTHWIAARPMDFAPAFVECWKALPAAQGD